MHDMSSFDEAMKAITRGAGVLKTVLTADADADGYVENDEQIKVSGTAYCLQIAHRVWETLEGLKAQQRQQQSYQQAAHSAGTMLGSLMGGSLGGGPIPAGSVDAAKQSRHLRTLTSFIGDLPPDELANIRKALEAAEAKNAEIGAGS